MAANRAAEAEEYLRENKIMDLVNNLTGLLLYYRPERPREFLISQLEKLKLARLADSGYPCLFDESNVEAVFGILDPAGQGYITGTQYTEALKTLGIDISSFPSPPENITLEVFKYDVGIHLRNTCATYKA
ncbi:EF-hand calcium-binding domain-containing protein 10 [Mantella aurantiaca]